MIENSDKYCSFAEYARRKKVAQAAINDAIKHGRVVVAEINGKRMVDVVASDEVWGASIKTQGGDMPELSGGAGDAAAESVSNAYRRGRAAKEIADAELKRLKLEMQMGKLVNAAEVEIQAFNDGRKVRNAIMALPDRLAPVIAAETDLAKVHLILVTELTNVLKGVAREIRDGS